MNFDRSDVVKLLQAFDESDWDTIHISADGFELYLSTGAVGTQPPPPAVATAPPAVAVAAQPVVVQPVPTEPEHAPDRPQAPVPDVEGLTVTAPSVGRFYRAPSPGAPPFVEVGDAVTPETTVCIVEVMKLMNPVKAEASGRVAAILVENAENVARGQALFVLTPNETTEASN